MASKDTNAAATFAANVSSMGERLQDIKTYDPSSSSSAGFLPGAAAHISEQMLHPSRPGMHEFIQAFHGHGPDPKLAIPPPMGPFGPLHHALHRPPGVHSGPQPGLDAAMMADEFARLNFQQAQHPAASEAALVREFESIYRQPLHRPPPPHVLASHANWAAEFEQRRAAEVAMKAAVPPPAMVAAAGPLHAQWAAEFDQQQMVKAPINAGLSVPPVLSTTALSQSHPPTESELEDIYGEAEADAVSNQDLESAYESATSESSQWVNEFENEQKADSGAGGMAGGLNKEMLDKLMNSNDPKWRNSKFLNFINRISKGEIEFRDNQVVEKQHAQAAQDWATEFSQQHAQPHNPLAQAANWAQEFQENSGLERQKSGKDEEQSAENTAANWASQFGQEEDYDAEFDTAQGEAWSKEYEEHWKDLDWANVMQRVKAPENKEREYKFQRENPFLNSAHPYEDGIRLLETGDLKNAILALEAEVQRNGENAEAWCLLGRAQAENEDENNAIAALMKCISLDPYNLKALLMLGVSYTNDLEEHRALDFLKTWLVHNPDYQLPVIQQQSKVVDEYLANYGAGNGAELAAAGGGGSGLLDDTLHREVTKLYLSAVQINPNDADVHQVLGVLYHIIGDFDHAVDAFKNAVRLAPNDASLWNKLGATQANGARSTDAVEAYLQALKLRPGYVRALANLAIAYANQGLHDDAVKWYLTTLKHNPTAEHIWSYLRISLSHLGKDTLIEMSHSKNVELFRPYYQF